MKDSKKKGLPNQLSLWEDFHAKTYPLQEKEQELSKENDQVFGRSLQGSSKMYSQRGLLLKMYQPFDLKDLPWSYKISTRSGTMQNGIVYPVPQLVGYTEEIAYGLSQDQVKYPTPTVGCVEGGEQSDRVEKTATGSYILRKKNKPHMTYGAKLSDAILFEEKQKRDMWATPNTLDHMPPRSKEAMERQFATTRKGRTKPSNLREQVHPDMWPTPRAGLGMGMKLTKNMAKLRHKKYLETEVAYKFWETPYSGMHKVDTDNVEYHMKRKKKGKQIGLPGQVHLEERKPGHLNPTWVEWLMGYPEDYTLIEEEE